MPQANPALRNRINFAAGALIERPCGAVRWIRACEKRCDLLQYDGSKKQKARGAGGGGAMEDLLLQEARERGLADERGLYLAANVVADGKQLGRV